MMLKVTFNFSSSTQEYNIDNLNDENFWRLHSQVKRFYYDPNAKLPNAVLLEVWGDQMKDHIHSIFKDTIPFPAGEKYARWTGELALTIILNL